MVKEKVPCVLICDQNNYIDFREPNTTKLFIEGKCDEQIRKLVAECGWTNEFEAILPDVHKTSSAYEAMILEQEKEEWEKAVADAK